MVEHSEYQKEIDRAIDEKLSIIRNKNYGDNVILIFGSFTSWNEKICAYLDNLSKKLSSHRIIIVSEGIFVNENELNERYSCEFIQVPIGLEHGRTAMDGDVLLNPEEAEDILNKKYLRHAINNIKLQTNSFGSMNSVQFVLWAYKFYSSILDIIKPDRIMMWNEYFSNHFILNHISQEKNIPVMVMEYGAITGTYSIDLFGSFGKSYPSVCSKEFEKIKVTNEELELAKQFIEKQKIGKYNQYAQPDVDLNDFWKMKGKIPIVVYMGTAHFDSGFATDEDSIPFNSPMFSSDYEVLLHLRKICDLHGWLLIHKPHPILSQNYNLQGVSYIEKCDVNDLFDLADVVITVSSKITYLTMIRNKATISLGYTQINFKNIVYEAYEKEQIESKISEAISNGITEEMKNNFVKHIAQMNHYLFDNNQDKSWNYGLPLENAAHILENPLCDSDHMVYDDRLQYSIKKYKKELLKRNGQNNMYRLYEKIIYVLKEIGLLSKQKTK